MLQDNLGYQLVRTTGPATALSALAISAGVTFIELVKAQARLPNKLADATDAWTEENVHITMLTDAAYDKVEELSSLILLNSTFSLFLPEIPSGGIYGRIRLPVGPASAISSVKYFDGDNAEQTWESTNYQLEPAIADWQADLQLLSLNGKLPAVHQHRANPITVVFVAGCGTTVAAIPAGARLAVAQLAAFWYRDREAFVAERMPPQDGHPFWGLLNSFSKTF